MPDLRLRSEGGGGYANYASGASQIALMSTEADAQITFLEKSLLQLNQRQGLGFLVPVDLLEF